MKEKLLSGVTNALLAIIFLFLALTSFHHVAMMIGYFCIAIVNFVLALLLIREKVSNRREQLIDDDERDQYIQVASDSQSLKTIKIIHLSFFVIFMILYYVNHENLILGVIGIVSIINWFIITITQFVFALIENNRN